MNHVYYKDTASKSTEVTVEEGNTLQHRLTTAPSQQATLRDCVAKALGNYFSQLDGQDVSNVYEMVLSEVEVPLLEKVLEYTRGNQTKAATMLGLNRGTLRKKLKQYGLI